MCLKPEHIRISTSSPAERPVNCFDGKLVPTAVLGDRIDHVVGTGECELWVRSEVSVRIRRADDVFIWAQPSDLIILSTGDCVEPVPCLSAGLLNSTNAWECKNFIMAW